MGDLFHCSVNVLVHGGHLDEWLALYYKGGLSPPELGVVPSGVHLNSGCLHVTIPFKAYSLLLSLGDNQ